MKKLVFAITFAIIVILTMNFRCRKEILAPPPPDYEFAAEVDIYPLKKSYSLSDTIWIETDLPTKDLYDKRSAQLINADTNEIPFGATYNEFGTAITNPPNGFCEIISSNGNTVLADQSPWSTSGFIEYGCGQPSFKCRIGFKPLHRGVYFLPLIPDGFLESCPTKIKRLYATISFRYKNVDLNLDVYNSLPASLRGDNNSVSFFTGKINNREMFVFRVQ